MKHEGVRCRNNHRLSFPECRFLEEVVHDGLVISESDHRDVAVHRIRVFTSLPKRRKKHCNLLPSVWHS